MKVVCITGTPGTGKTRLAKNLAKKLKAKYIDVNKIIKDYQLKEGFDKKRGCNIIDEKKLSKVLVHIIKKDKGRLVIDSHLSHFIPKKFVDLCIITKCNLKTLSKRLQKRGYNPKKVRENLDAEIFDVCLNEAKEIMHKTLIIDTSTGKISELTEMAVKILRKPNRKVYK